MDIDKFNFSECIDLNNGLNSEIKIEEFYKLKNIIIHGLKGNNIDSNKMNMYYQRFEDATSMLAIKVKYGNDFDRNNYMFICSKTFDNSVDNLHCDVYMHADSKVGQKSLEIINYLSVKPFVDFFENIEKDLYTKGLNNLNFSISIPLGNPSLEIENKGMLKKLARTVLDKIKK